MANDDVVSGKVVWGYTVPLGSDGKRMWPAAVKQIALRKLAEGATTRNVAAEIGVTDALIYKWVKAGRDRASTPRFVELLPPKSVGDVPDKPHRDGGQTGCVVRIGGTEVTIPPGFPAGDLAGILRAVRETA